MKGLRPFVASRCVNDCLGFFYIKQK